MNLPMSDEEAADWYADPANQRFDPQRVVNPGALGASLPVRFPMGMVERVRGAAGAEGVTVSEWVRQAVADALSRYDEHSGQPTDVAAKLERLARELRRSA